MRELSKQIIEHVRRAEEPAGVRTSVQGEPGSHVGTLAAEAIRIARAAASIHLARVAWHESDDPAHLPTERSAADVAGESPQLAREHRP